MSKITALSKDDIIKIAPSIYAGEHKSGLSSQYKFISTGEVIEVMKSKGWYPVKVGEQNTRIEENKGFQKHLVQFQNMDKELLVGDTIFRIVLTNSHNGLSSFKFMAGLFRLVCANGLIVSSGHTENLRVLHKGYSDNNVIDVVGEIVDDMPAIASNVSEMQKISLTEEERLLYTKSAVSLRYDEDTVISYDRFLQPRRLSDNTNDLWAVYNRVQENIIKGGLNIYQKDEAGQVKMKRVRKVKSISQDIKLNKSLWTLTEAMLKLKKEGEKK